MAVQNMSSEYTFAVVYSQANFFWSKFCASKQTNDKVLDLISANTRTSLDCNSHQTAGILLCSHSSSHCQMHFDRRQQSYSHAAELYLEVLIFTILTVVINTSEPTCKMVNSQCSHFEIMQLNRQTADRLFGGKKSELACSHITLVLNVALCETHQLWVWSHWRSVC